MAGALDIDISDLVSLARTVQGAEPVVKRNLSKGGRKAGFIVEGNAKVEAPVRDGTLRASIGPPKVSQSGIATTIEVKAHAEHAYVVHEGRGEIRPVNAKVLRWEGPNGVVFAMRSGPVKPNPYMDRGLKKSETAIYRAFDQALEDTFRELGMA